MIRLCGFLFVYAVAHASPLDFARDVRPMLETYCFDCHDDEEKPKGGVNLERYGTEADALHDRETWAAVLEKVESHQMPPPKRKTQPSQEERARILAWINHARRSTGSRARCSGPWKTRPAPPDPA